jgi:DNA-binding transcriptional MocR family regulator
LGPGARAGAEEAGPATPVPRPHPDPISFTGFGDPQRFPVEEFGRAMRLVIRRDGVEALAFDDAAGYAPLRATIAGLLGIQGASRPGPDRS